MKKKKLVCHGKIFFIITLAFIACGFMATSSWAAKKIEFYSTNAKSFIGELNQKEIRESAAMGPIFGLSQDEEFILLRQRTDFNQVTHYRYQQVYNGIPVWGTQTIISRGPSNQVVRLHGTMALDISKDIKHIPSSLDPKGALKKMKEKHKKQNIGAKWHFGNEKYGLYIYVDTKEKANLCYVVSFFADTEYGSPSQYIHFIEVTTGNVLHSFDTLKYQCTGPGGNLKVGYYYYGVDYPPFGCTEIDGICYTVTEDVKTIDLKGGTSGDAASFPCYENICKPINGAYCPVNDAQFFGQVAFDVYRDWYGVPILPFQLILKCHYGLNYENVFWDGSSITFGDGYTTFYPLVCLDIIVHEASHGFTEYHSDLIYSGESGGINESFSDQAGEGAKYYMRGTNDFMTGYDIFKDPDGALRYLYDPPLDGRSIDHVDDYYPGMDVHYSSGIFNKAFYLIATTSAEWGTQKAFNIFVKANMDYWTPNTNFQQGAEGAQDAAADYGYSCQDVADAFAIVGIPLTCGVEGSITVVSPNGGEQWPGGSTQTITWTSTGTIANVKIFYSTNGGKKWANITDSTLNTGSYDWTLPTVRKTKTKCRVKVTSLDESVEDMSDADFSITN